MKSVDIGYVIQYGNLQRQLVAEFLRVYPGLRDSKWLLDFPKNGAVEINNEHWKFVKHGAGLRFVRSSAEPYLVVDVHKDIGKPGAIDKWRLIHFFESCGKRVAEDQLSPLLMEMCLKGLLTDQGDGEYLLSESAVKPLSASL
jgi:hypothetical protein